MAKRSKEIEQEQTDDLDFSGELIKSLNKEFSTRIAYNLADGDSPTHVKRWISTGSILLDYAIANRKNGGVPEGRIIEIAGETASGKTHLAFAIARTVQQMGGIVVFIDTEAAVSVDRLKHMGIDISRRFVYVTTHETEQVFQIAESTIAKAKQMVKDVPVLIVWDSVAQTSPKMELEGTYEQSTVGLQARVISKGMRKITGVISDNNVIFLCLNQLRSAVNVGPYADPNVTSGGKALPYASSVRLMLTGGGPIKDSSGLIIGSKTNITVKKNKVGPPFKRMSLQILFGKGIYEDEALFEELFNASKKGTVERNGVTYSVEGPGAWKIFRVTKDGSSREVKFYKSEFAEKVLNNPDFKDDILEMIDIVLVTDMDSLAPASDEDGYVV